MTGVAVTRRALAGVAVLLAGCMSPTPKLYTLAIVPGPEQHGAPKVVEVRAIALAHYLERSQIVRSSENYRLDVLGNDWWGEPLDAMLARVLVQELTQRLPGSVVFSENSALTTTPDAVVEINVQRLDEDRSGEVVLAAQVAVRGRRKLIRNLRLTVRPTSAGAPGLVAAMSTATGQLADVIATMLSGR
jgi:uncharacterized lipoprotein YmbA